MDSLKNSQEKVSLGVPSGPCSFTFVPVVQRLPFKSLIAEEERPAALTGKPNTGEAMSDERTTRGTMSDTDVFKAERVFIRESAAGGAGSMVPPETQLKWNPAPGHVSLSRTQVSASVSAQPENTRHHIAAVAASTEAAVDKCRGISPRPCHHTAGRAEVSSSCFAKRVSEDRSSPTHSADLASSRESLLSEDRSWCPTQPSSVTSPASLSRTVSPCSSVRSGAFTPSVTHIRRHFLAPGSSLVHIPQTCLSSCEDLSPSVCPLSPPPRHRPPLTRLSLLTAILRKGRLPVLSSVLQRPYTPCWPVNPVTLSFCNACSAATSVASIPLECFSPFSSSLSIDGSKHVYKEPNRCVAAPPASQTNEGRRVCHQTQKSRRSELICSVPRWEQVISPPPVRSSGPRAPHSLFRSDYRSTAPAEHEEILACAACKQLQQRDVSVPLSPELTSSNTHTHLRGHVENNNKKPSPKHMKAPEPSAPQRPSYSTNSSLSRLQLLSQKLRSGPVCSPLPQPQPPPSRSPAATLLTARTDAASPLPPSPHTAGRCESERRCPTSEAAAPSQGPHCLSPSRYTPISFLGWPSPTCSPTPTPSPAPPIRDFTPSPSLSQRSITASPRPGSGISDCSDREGKKRKTHKIKLSYKSLAAIPTNTLLLDQQAIDEQVERETPDSCETPDRGVAMERGAADTHAEMCSPAQLRQQSEELYAVIDEILANSIPTPSRSPTVSAGLQHNNSHQSKSLGRETKYASLSSLPQSASMETNMMDSRKTKPGVIRPMTAIPRLTIEDDGDSHPHPLRQSVAKQTATNNKKVESRSRAEAGHFFHASSKGAMMRDGRKTEKSSPLSACDLQITEPEEPFSQ